MKKGRKKKTKKTNSENPTNSGSKRIKIHGDETITVLSPTFEDGQSVGSYLRDGGKMSAVRAAIKAGSIELNIPDYDDQ